MRVILKFDSDETVEADDAINGWRWKKVVADLLDYLDEIVNDGRHLDGKVSDVERAAQRRVSSQIRSQIKKSLDGLSVDG